MKLAQNEQIIKEWEYATSQNRADTMKHSLTVTNKRIIAASRGAHKVTQEEVATSDVKSVSLSHYVPSKFFAILMIVLSVVSLAVGIFLFVHDEDTALYGIPLVALFAILLLIGIMNLHQGVFTLTLMTEGTQSFLLGLGAMRLVRKSKKKGATKVKVNNEVADEIMETLGALIVEAKN